MISEDLTSLLISEHEEDYNLGIEIMKRKNIQVTEDLTAYLNARTEEWQFTMGLFGIFTLDGPENFEEWSAVLHRYRKTRWDWGHTTVSTTTTSTTYNYTDGGSITFINNPYYDR